MRGEMHLPKGELRRRGEKFRISLPSWYFALELSRRHGWEPSGTRRHGCHGKARGFRADGSRHEPGPHQGDCAWYNG